MYTKVIKSEFVKVADEDPDEPSDVKANSEHIHDPNKSAEDTSRKENVIDAPLVGQRIHISDLNNALRYSLFREVALKKRLNSTQLNALKNYLSVLELHFPFQTDKMRTFVKLLNEWLSKKKAGVEVDIEDMLTTMKIYEDYYHFPDMKPWKECAGSDPKYRGYPCSMWTLFHTLTVAEYKTHLNNKKWANLHSVLYAMRDYIINFFGCSDCAQHFKQMATDLESELIHPNSSVLWLWRAHNKVNKRLKGEPSEDPAHPKRPYPYRNECPECYENADPSTESKFNENNVLEFLVRHYSSDNLIKDESELNEPKPDNNQSVERAEKNGRNSGKSDHSVHEANNTSVKAKWNYSLLNNMDYSLILVLYFFSAAIIVTLCVYLKIRVRKRGQKYTTLKSPMSFA